MLNRDLDKFSDGLEDWSPPPNVENNNKVGKKDTDNKTTTEVAVDNFAPLREKGITKFNLSSQFDKLIQLNLLPDEVICSVTKTELKTKVSSILRNLKRQGKRSKNEQRFVICAKCGDPPQEGFKHCEKCFYILASESVIAWAKNNRHPKEQISRLDKLIQLNLLPNEVVSLFEKKELILKVNQIYKDLKRQGKRSKVVQHFVNCHRCKGTLQGDFKYCEKCLYILSAELVVAWARTKLYPNEIVNVKRKCSDCNVFIKTDTQKERCKRCQIKWQYNENVKNGICTACEEKKIDINSKNKTTCADCAAKKAKNSREKYDAAKGLFICTQCNSDQAYPGGSLCLSCSLKQRFALARYQAIKEKKLAWDLTRDYYYSIIGQPCYYCELVNDVKLGVGLDRLSNLKGYIKGNVVSCCYRCNVMRNDFATPDEFKMFFAPAVRQFRLYKEMVTQKMENECMQCKEKTKNGYYCDTCFTAISDSFRKEFKCYNNKSKPREILIKNVDGSISRAKMDD